MTKSATPHEKALLPKLMVAPNGARLTRADHPAIPINISDIVKTAKACRLAGADGIHAHVRDQTQTHVLDAGLYRELLRELACEVPDMLAQISTEAVGRYSPQQQIALVRAVEPKAVSIALAELTAGGCTRQVREFYHWAEDRAIALQHVLYSPDELEQWFHYVRQGIIPESSAQLLFVLGRYSKTQNSQPDDLVPYLERLKKYGGHQDWAVCAFGKNETRCLAEAFRRGGKLRVGFENNVYNEDGRVAKDNAERVRKIAQLMETG